MPLSARKRMQAYLDGGSNFDRPPVALWQHFPVDDQDPGTLAADTLDFQWHYDFDLVKVTPASSFSIKDWGAQDWESPIVNWHDRETSPTLEEAQNKFTGVVSGGVSQKTMVFGNRSQAGEEANDAIRQTQGRRLLLGTGCVVPVIASYGNILAAHQSVEGSI